MPDTATAVLEPLVAPFPSWPLSPLPQHLAAPDAVSAQVWALPEEKLALCEQKKPLGVPVFLHALLEIQVCVFNAHWSLIEHSYPFPEKPGLQEQLKEPMVLTQDELAGQLWLFNMHSLTSEQEKTFPE